MCFCGQIWRAESGDRDRGERGRAQISIKVEGNFGNVGKEDYKFSSRN